MKQKKRLLGALAIIIVLFIIHISYAPFFDSTTIQDNITSLILPNTPILHSAKFYSNDYNTQGFFWFHQLETNYTGSFVNQTANISGVILEQGDEFSDFTINTSRWYGTDTWQEDGSAAVSNQTDFEANLRALNETGGFFFPFNNQTNEIYNISLPISKRIAGGNSFGFVDIRFLDLANATKYDVCFGQWSIACGDIEYGIPSSPAGSLSDNNVIVNVSSNGTTRIEQWSDGLNRNNGTITFSTPFGIALIFQDQSDLNHNLSVGYIRIHHYNISSTCLGDSSSNSCWGNSSITGPSTIGTYAWRMWGRDTVGNWNVTDFQFIDITNEPYNTSAPFDNSSSVWPKRNDGLNMSVRWADDDNSTLRIQLETNITGSMANLTNITLSANNTVAQFNETVSLNKGQDIYWRLWAFDRILYNVTSFRQITVQNTNLTIDVIQPANQTIFTRNSANYLNFSFFLNDTDADTLGIQLWIDGSPNNFNSSVRNATNTTLQNNASLTNGTHTWYFAYNDSTAVLNSTTTYFTIDMEGSGITNATVNPISATSGSNFTFGTNITPKNQANISTVTFEVLRPSSLKENVSGSISLGNVTANSRWEANYTNTGLIGDYTLTHIYTQDNNSNNNTFVANIIFTSTAQQGSGAEGGGGGGAVNEQEIKELAEQVKSLSKGIEAFQIISPRARDSNQRALLDTNKFYFQAGQRRLFEIRTNKKITRCVPDSLDFKCKITGNNTAILLIDIPNENEPSFVYSAGFEGDGRAGIFVQGEGNVTDVLIAKVKAFNMGYGAPIGDNILVQVFSYFITFPIYLFPDSEKYGFVKGVG